MRVSDDEIRVSDDEIRVSNDEIRVSNEMRVSNDEIRISNDEIRVSNDEIRVLNVSNQEVESKGGEKGRYVVVNGEMVKKKGGGLEDYDSRLSMSDDFARDGNRFGVGNGYEVGDMVWGKVKSHPWWPGHIYSEEFASASLKRNKREGHVLVAFFGDSSYGWFELAELIPFEENFEEKSRQTNSRTFVRAVEEAVEELRRRSRMGLACRCRNPYNFRASTVEGFYAVDAGDNEPGVIFSASQIERARDNFKPREILGLMKKIAMTPMEDRHRSTNFVKHIAATLAYRKAKFEEFDETYAQAFGARSARSEPKSATDLQRGPYRAPLCGPLVFAEALGKGKASAKSTMPQDHVEKDKYLFKRRDEPHKFKTQKAGKRQPSKEPSQLDRGSMPGRETTSMETQVLQTTGMGNTSRSPSDQPTPVTRSIGDNGTKLHAKGSEPGPKKSKAKKRLAGQLLSEDSIVSEKKNKKRKKEAGVEFSSDRNQISSVSGFVGASVVEAPGKMVQVASPAELDYKSDNQTNNDENKSLHVTSPAEGSLKEKQKEDDAALTSMPLVSMETKQIDGSKNSEAELRKYIGDLRALAVEPLQGAERSGSLFVRKIFLKFRCLVYQKSLVSLAMTEADTSESRMPKLPSSVEVSNNHPINHVKETLPVRPPTRPSNPPSRADYPTIGGRKRGSSDRQEEIAAKRKKKIATIKSMATEKKPPQKASDGHPGERTEAARKLTGLTSAKPVRFESSKKTEPVAKQPDPTMLIMKFPPGATLPSLNELKAKFTRFGTLDASKTRIFWQSYQVRLVYLHRNQAESASKFVINVWNPNVRCSLRDLSADISDSVHPKVEDAAVSTSKSDIEPRQTPKLAPLPLQQPSQLKSCLKKSPVEEGGTIGGGGNGSGRGTRVKFVLGGDESSKTEQLMVGNIHVNNNASFADGDVSSSTSHAMDFNSKNIPVMSSSQLPSVPLLPPKFPQPSNNIFFNEDPSRNIPNSDIDITQQMISLLRKCNDVVSSLKATLGYVPYHPL